MIRVDWREFDLGQLEKLPLLPRRRGNPGRKHPPIYCQNFATFDTETTTIEYQGAPQAFVYVWMFYLPHIDTMVTGRTIREFGLFAANLAQILPGTLVVYDHNLSYEFQFLAGIYDFDGGGKDSEVFALKSRKVCKCMMHGKLEFRCSQILSNMSLAVYTKKYHVKHAKLSGDDFNYSAIRYPWTALTDQEWAYCTNDVIGLAECIQVELDLGHFTLETIPLTSTGFVRRDLKAAMRAVSHNLVPSLVPDYDTYLMLRAAFRGGDVHANRYYAGEIQHECDSYDRSSSYPDVLCNCKFPMSAFVPIEEQHRNLRGLQMLINRNRAFVVVLYCTDVKLRNPRWGSPYLPYDKCDICREDQKSTVLDNGRILECPALRVTMTDVDLRIFLREYDCDIVVLDGRSARYGMLPFPYVETVQHYYRLKTSLKNVEGQEVYYEKSKNKLNSCYGCAAQDSVKITDFFINGEWISGDSPECPEELRQNKEQLYAEYTRTAWASYAWGVWCTAWARYRLFEGVCIVSAEYPDRPERKANATSDFIYSDTDSVKFIGKADFSAYNAERQRDSMNSGSHAADPAGHEHYMGVYENDSGGGYKEFLTIGAKQYAYTDREGKLHITISGVSKKNGAAELEVNGGLECMRAALWNQPFIFREAGGTQLIYNDNAYYGSLEIDGHRLEISRNVVIADDTFTLGMPKEYYLLINSCRIDFE